jgi:hypothetical protein
MADDERFRAAGANIGCNFADDRCQVADARLPMPIAIRASA